MPRNFIELFRTRKTNDSVSLALCYAGKESCLPGHFFGPASRAHYLIHFILNGKGQFVAHSNVYNLGSNQLFIIKPGETSYYTADEKEPWEYIWIAFMGSDVTTILQNCGLLNDPPVANFSPEPRLINALEDMISQLQLKSENDYALLGNLYTVFGCLSNNYHHAAQTCQNIYLRQALNFIHNNYSHNNQVSDIAEYLKIDRTYLYRLFMDEFKMPPKKYLQQYQLKMALQLLTNSDMAIKEISYTCGFPDPAAFSKRFSAAYGFTPRQFRQIDGDAVLSYIEKDEK